MSMRQLAKLINKAALITDPADKFLFEYNNTLVSTDVSDPVFPVYRPSSLGGCSRELYYIVTGVEAPPERREPQNIDICNSGTDRHLRIQNNVMKMKDMGYDCEWLDVEEYLKEHPVEGTTVVKDRNCNETRCQNSKYNLYFSCDGLIRYNGELYILEIKTESTFKFSGQVEPYKHHIAQATAYAFGLGISKIMFLYENRDICNKKTFVVEVTDEMKQTLVVDKINYVQSFVETKTPPPKSTDKGDCTYCDYKSRCRRDG